MMRFFQSFGRSFLDSAFVLVKLPAGLLLVVLSLCAFLALTFSMFACGFGVLMMLFVAVMTGHVFVSLFWAAAYFCGATFCAQALRYFWGPMIRRWLGLDPLPGANAFAADEPFYDQKGR